MHPPFRTLARNALSAADEQLVAAALAARLQAYAPYSRFLVGAAVQTTTGKLFVGCNVENVSFGLTNCAERTAIFSAVTAGERGFSGIAIASAGGVTPCGACRQVLAEFAPALRVLIVDANADDPLREWSLGDLLPGQFFADDLAKD